MVLYMAVTADELELPLYVADNVRDLAEHCGVSQGAVFSAIYRRRSGKRYKRKYVKVEVENDGEID